VLGSLSLDVAHNFTALDQTELHPVAHVHLQDVSLAQLDLRLGQKVQIGVLKKRCDLTFALTFVNLFFSTHELLLSLPLLTLEHRSNF